MPIVDREALVEELANRIGAILRNLGELPGANIVSTLGEMTGEPESDVRLALGRVSLNFLPGGNVALGAGPHAFAD